LLFLILFFVSEAQTPSPLIRPADSIFGGTVRGNVKIDAGGTLQPQILFDFTSGAISIAPYARFKSLRTTVQE
jgi:hypothetical protein